MSTAAGMTIEAIEELLVGAHADGRAILVTAAARPDLMYVGGGVRTVDERSVQLDSGQWIDMGDLLAVRLLADSEPGVIWLVREHAIWDEPTFMSLHVSRAGAQARLDQDLFAAPYVLEP